MPTKMNSAGQQQPYVPAGYGDASGEYADSKYGSNKNYVSPKDTSRQLPYKSENQKDDINEIKKQLNGGKEVEIPKEKKSKDYTYKFAKEVEITRNSLNEEEIGVLNQYLDDIFNDYPLMQKFQKISIKNNTKSSTGGYIKTSINYFTGEKKYELYINSGWLQKQTYREKTQENVNFYKERIKETENSPLSQTEKDFLLKNFKDNIDYWNEKLKNPVYSNVFDRVDGRKERLKNLISHEIMHRITQTFDGYNVNKYAGDIEKNNEINLRYNEIKNEIREAYSIAIKNGDAKKISKYAQVNREEFLSEANAMIEGGFEVPDYIRNTIYNIKRFLRSEQ